MSIDALARQQRALQKKIKGLDSDNIDRELVQFYRKAISEIQNCVEFIPTKDDNILYSLAVERIKAVLDIVAFELPGQKN